MVAPGRKVKQSSRYDTSRCQVKFRKPRIVLNRGLNFDPKRTLYFDSNRVIEARLEGVVFRDRSAIGFRNLGISNLENVMDRSDWPDVGKAAPPETMRVQRTEDWEETWGRDVSFTEKWGGSPLQGQEQMTFERIPSKEHGYQVKDQSIERPAHPGTRVTVEEEPIPWTEGVSGEDAIPVQFVPREDKRKANILNEQGLSFMQEGEHYKALNYFQRAMELDPKEPVYRTNLERCEQWIEYIRKGGYR